MSVLVKFEDGWPWPIFRGHWGQFQHENLKFSIVNTITQQILVALGPNLYHGCISGVSWLSSKMDELDLFFEVMGSIVNTTTQQILISLGPNLCHGCILAVSWKNGRWMTMTYFSRSWESISTWKFDILACKHDNSTNISGIRPKHIPWMYLRSVLVNKA